MLYLIYNQPGQFSDVSYKPSERGILNLISTLLLVVRDELNIQLTIRTK